MRVESDGSLVKASLIPVAAIGVAATIGITTTPFMGLATISYAAMVAGYLQRFNKTAHMRLMLFAIFLDLSLVLTLEAQRGAIDTALSMKLGILQQAHILASSIATVLYFPVLYMGFRLWKKSNPELKVWHTRIGKSAFFFRTLGFLLMFTLLGHENI
jgi:hypothetical protein